MISFPSIAFCRIYQIRVSARRMPKEVASCRKRSYTIEARHRETHGTILNPAFIFLLTNSAFGFSSKIG